MRLPTYLAKRLFLLLAIFLPVWLFLTIYVHETAWDETTLHYVYYDLDEAIDYPARLPINNQSKLITTDRQDLPAIVQKRMQQGLLVHNELILISEPQLDTYALRYHFEAQDYYVLHFFPKSSAYSSLTLFAPLFILSVLLLAGFLWRTTQKVDRQVQQLIDEVNKRSGASKSYAFTEFEELAYTLKLARYAEHHAQQQSQAYSALLSHELRTPLTQIGHGLSQLDLLDDLPLESLPIIEQLNQSQQHLSDTCVAILTLWRPNPNDLKAQNLVQLFEGVCQHAKQSGLKCTLNIDVNTLKNQVTEHTEQVLIKHLHPTLFNLMTAQIIKNAMQHGRGPLTIELNDSTVTFYNEVNPDAHSPGHGLGRYLIEQTCVSFGWQVHIDIVSKAKVQTKDNEMEKSNQIDASIYRLTIDWSTPANLN